MNSIDALQSAAIRLAAEDKLRTIASEVRAKLVLGRDAISVFFASIALRLDIVPSFDIPTAATDGRRLMINPEWFSRLTVKHRIGVFAHEIMHIANRHHLRRGKRQNQRWNIACDLAINQLLIDAGFSLPEAACLPGRGSFSRLPKGESAETYYELLDGQFNSDQSDGSSDPGGCGAVQDAGTDQSQLAEAEAEADIMISQAEMTASQRGELPKELTRFIRREKRKTDWRSILRQFIQKSIFADYTWSTPNRRFISRGIYLPSIRRDETIGEIVVAIDTSGSIDGKTLSQFASEIDAIASCDPVKVHVLSCDSAVHRVDVWEPVDGPLQISSFPGGGGTSHVPVWDWLSQSNVNPSCVICLTDGDTDFGQNPGVPVLWAFTKSCQPPFGEMITIS